MYSLLPMAFFPKEGFGQRGFNEAPQVIKSYNSRPKIHTWLTERRL